MHAYYTVICRIEHCARWCLASLEESRIIISVFVNIILVLT